ncbi:MAG TPA: FAD:protein FMN transferase, partial [Candidatus Dormibacteraeota bacterium]|nr:FAD:protein FMN transferase [Candidatus Dormibacteraeota bacterium]
IDVTEGGDQARTAVERAFGWFEYVERVCSRFDENSEVVSLSRLPGRPLRVSRTLFQLIEFALALNRLSNGAFDVTVGGLMESRGFDRNYRTGGRHGFAGAIAPALAGEIVLDAEERTVMLARPFLLDLGAVAKGLAIDLAARELGRFAMFSIDAGGDIYVAGQPEKGGWRVGVQDPERGGAAREILKVADAAVCTSGGYQRVTERPGQHHVLDPRTRVSPGDVLSATVVAPNAMLADGLSTALFILGAEGLALVATSGAHGMVIGKELGRQATAGFDSMVVEVAA